MRMSEMLFKIRALKQKAVEAVIGGTDVECDQVDQEIDAFLAEHRYMVLDMLDDALTAYEGGTWDGR